MKSKLEEIQESAMTRIYGQDVLMEIFGSLKPTAIQRASKTYDLMEAWAETTVKLRISVNPLELRKKLKDIGLREYQDYVMFGGDNCIAFRDSECMSIAMLTINDFFEQ